MSCRVFRCLIVSIVISAALFLSVSAADVSYKLVSQQNLVDSFSVNRSETNIYKILDGVSGSTPVPNYGISLLSNSYDIGGTSAFSAYADMATQGGYLFHVVLNPVNGILISSTQFKLSIDCFFPVDRTYAVVLNELESPLTLQDISGNTYVISAQFESRSDGSYVAHFEASPNKPFYIVSLEFDLFYGVNVSSSSFRSMYFGLSDLMFYYPDPEQILPPDLGGSFESGMIGYETLEDDIISSLPGLNVNDQISDIVSFLGQSSSVILMINGLWSMFYDPSTNFILIGTMLSLMVGLSLAVFGVKK